MQDAGVSLPKEPQLPEYQGERCFEPDPWLVKSLLRPAERNEHYPSSDNRDEQDYRYEHDDYEE
jgi:hypothetical protein